MNVGTLENNLAFLLGFNNGQTNQDFTQANLDFLLNEAYTREIERAQREGTIRWFKQYTTATWPANQLTFTLPVDVTQNQIIALIDVTNGTPGYQFVIADQQDTGGLFWLDYQTLQWGFIGPASAVTIGIEYIAAAENLTTVAPIGTNTQVPKWIPPQHHSVIYWSAACLGRKLADEAAPQAWESELRGRQESLWQYLSSAKPMYGHFMTEEGRGEY